MDIYDGTLDQIPRPIIEPIKANIMNDNSIESREYTRDSERILKQTRSDILTNGFIPKEQKDREIRQMEIVANNIVSDAYRNHNLSLKEMTIGEIMTNMSDACVGISRDIYKKPEGISWGEYSSVIILKNGRYKYIGILIILVVVYIYISK
jgi:hypothetical protein